MLTGTRNKKMTIKCEHKGCDAVVVLENERATRVGVRREARQRGWISKTIHDFCPEHREDAG